MNQSCLDYTYGKLGNEYKISLYNDDQIMTINKSEDLEKFKFIGINCFEEIQSSSDFYSFLNQSFP
jgi:hypothetical protein